MCLEIGSNIIRPAFYNIGVIRALYNNILYVFYFGIVMMKLLKCTFSFNGVIFFKDQIFRVSL